MRKKPCSPQGWPQELRTIQYGTPSSSPHPTTLTMWLVAGSGLYSV